MKRREVSPSGMIGACSLLTIFGVLCMTILALLCLRTALTEKQMAETSAQAVCQWYRADLEAQTIYAELRTESTVSGEAFDEDLYEFEVPVSQKQALEVVLKKEDNGWTILRWQTAAHPDEVNETLPVWQGDE